jgi:RNA polymerase sigma-70 factor, ECF subfamily
VSQFAASRVWVVVIDPEDAFTSVRRRLFALAYRMLGSRADAEDLVQEAYVRWHQAERATIDNPEAWLVTTATRLAIDRLRRLKTEREGYVGAWLPEPIVSDMSIPGRDLELASDLSLAMLTILETLAPEERAAFLLHDVFDVDYARVASVLNKTESACRQMIHRARERVRGDRRRFESTDEARLALLKKFKLATETADEAALLALFTPDVVWTADGGGKVSASPKPLVGLDRVIGLLMGIARKWPPDRVIEITTVNGESGMLIRDGRTVMAVMAFDIDADRIAHVYAVLNPDKLASVHHES